MKIIIKLLNIIYQVGILYLLSLIGKWIQQYFSLAIPGSVIGLVILFLLLLTGIVKPYFIKSGADFMIKHLVLFFIPAVVGIVNYLYIFRGTGSWLIIITVISTIIVMIVCGKVVEVIEKNDLEKVV